MQQGQWTESHSIRSVALSASLTSVERLIVSAGRYNMQDRILNTYFVEHVLSLILHSGREIAFS